MKQFEDFTRKDLANLRKEVCLNSVFIADYRNSFGITARSACTFFEGYMEYLFELADEDGFNVEENYSEFFKKYDTLDHLEGWFGCHDDMSWVKYEEIEG